MIRKVTGVSLALVFALHVGAASAEAPAPFRDLNHNGRLDPYEDSRLSADARAEDLLARMSREEKVGTLLHGTLPAIGNPFGASDKGYDLGQVEVLVRERGITSMISRLAMSPAAFAAQNNAVQRIAERSRLGIPVTISTDPRNHFSFVAGASVSAAGFTQWPEPIGFAALGDASLIRQFGEYSAREYRAVGLHMALSPQADLATEPRWSRAISTFGADPETVSRLAGAYVEGFQGSKTGLTPRGVATVVKHFAGYGAEPKGFDAHNAYGARVSLTNTSFAQHLAAFEGPLRVHSAGLMPTYAIVQGVTVDGQSLEAVGAGFNRKLLSDLLRSRLAYDGLVISDWGIVNDCPEACFSPTEQHPQTPAAIAMPWGVENLSVEQRVARGVMAGIDQFGGFDDPAPLMAAVQSGAITTQRLDEAVRHVLLVKFRLGLFDKPYVDEDAATRLVGAPDAKAAADRAQREAIVLLQNGRSVLPLSRAVRKVWLFGIDPKAAQEAGFQVVANPKVADAAIIRMPTPSEKLHPHHFFGAMQNEGRLDYRDGDLGFEALKSVSGKVPTVLAIDLDRPAILTNVVDKVDTLLGVYGASDAAVIDVAVGRAQARGHLPVELPRSMEAVEEQRADLGNDSRDPLFRVGAGLGSRNSR